MNCICLLFVRRYHLSASVWHKNRILQLVSDMPKSSVHVPALKNQRQAKKVAQTRYPPAVINLQVLGNGAQGSPRSLYVFTDQSRYLFNCGESSQRLAHEHKLKLGKLEHLFFTHSSWKNLGGLPGVSLTIQDVGVPNIKLHGPPGLDDLFRAASRFIVLKDLEVSCVDATNPNASFEDSVMKVQYVPILPNSSEEGNITGQTDSSNSSSEDRDRSELPITTEPCAKKQKITDEGPLARPTPNMRAAVNYICQLQPKKGFLDWEKCVELRVPVGPLLGRLKEGQDVTLTDGRLIRSVDVRSPDDPGPVFIVVECPDESYLDSLLTNEKLKDFHVSNLKQDSDAPEVIVHFTPLKLTRHPEYVKWMHSFPLSTYHIHLGSPDDNEVCRRDLGSVAVHRIQHKLNLLHPDVFPLLPADLPIEGDLPNSEVNTETLLQYHLRPRKKVDRSMILSLTPNVYTSECYEVEDFATSLNDFKKRLSEKVLEGCEYPRIVFFGTGSQIPSKTRNTSGILVELEPQLYILLDCGEGTYNQLVRFFGPERYLDVLCNMAGIYISHLHADHHIGLIGMLQARQYARKLKKLSEQPLLLIAPSQINYWLQWYNTMMEPIQSQFQLISCQDLLSGSGQPSATRALNVRELKTCRVRHCPNAFGVAITTSEGFKFTYSGDTMPCDDLVSIGRDCDLLIHEATIEDGLENEAALKTHSTTSQAIDVGVRMGAKFTMLTHFSQRYAKIPIFGPQIHSNVGVAFDNMCIRPSQLKILPCMIPTLKLMFAEYYSEMEERGQRRQIRNEQLKLLK